MDQASGSSRDTVVDHLLGRLEDKLANCLNRAPLDRDHLQFICTQEMVIMSALSTQIPVPQAVTDAFVELHRLVSFRNPTQRIVRMEMGNNGRPRFIIDRDHVIELLEMGQNVTCIARLFGVSRWTMHRRMADWDLSVREMYSQMSDAELDELVRDILSRNPNAGYRRMIGLLTARGQRVQWNSVCTGIDASSRHSRDCLANVTVGLCSSQNILSSRSLVHIDTNHKLIRYNIVIFGGVDGFSRKRDLVCLKG
ncbi:unnamed protein product [Arctogadus glacialis]